MTTPNNCLVSFEPKITIMHGVVGRIVQSEMHLVEQKLKLYFTFVLIIPKFSNEQDRLLKIIKNKKFGVLCCLTGKKLKIWV